MIVTAYTVSIEGLAGAEVSELVYEVTDNDLAQLLIEKFIKVEIADDQGSVVQRHTLKLARRGR